MKYLLDMCINTVTVIRKCTKVVMYLGHLPQQRQRYAPHLCHPPVCTRKVTGASYYHNKQNLLLTTFQVSYPDLVHAVGLQLPQSRPETPTLNLKLCNPRRVKMLLSHRVSPVVLFNVFNKLRLDVRFPWNGDGLLHEWLIEINFIDLQLQLLSNLK